MASLGFKQATKLIVTLSILLFLVPCKGELALANENAQDDDDLAEKPLKLSTFMLICCKQCQHYCRCNNLYTCLLLKITHSGDQPNNMNATKNNKTDPTLMSKPITDQLTVSKPITNKSEDLEPITDQSNVSKPITNKSEDSEPIKDQSNVSKPITNKSEDSEPITDQSIASKIPLQTLWLGLLTTFMIGAVAYGGLRIFKKLEIKISDKHPSPDELVISGNKHKLNQQWLDAAVSFEQAAEVYSKLKRRGEHDAANNFSEAANCYRKLRQPDSIKKAVQSLQKASRIYAEVGQFSIAARQLEEAGDLFNANRDNGNSISAIELYLKAADFWSGEDSPASAAGSRGKAAHLMADIEKFDDAAKQFENLGVSSQQHSLLGFGASDYMFKACLCHLCLDPLRCADMADDLGRKCNSFEGSDEKSLVMKLSGACEAGDVAAFDRAVTEFERLNNLDDWSRRRLEVVRKRIAGESPGLV